jgi:ribosomal protein L7Ae-like RNA K-turn-binding protein
MANVVVSALATWNGKALKKAKQDVSVFDKQIKQLGRTFGITFSAAALVAFSKKAIRVFTEDEAAAKRLQLQLENTGNAFRVAEVEAYIKSLEKTLGILQDLRGPFQTFLNLTGSVELAQRSLEAALNISAGTGESLGTVVNAISAGIRGQTKAIKGLNTGIDESIIATGDMNKIMAALEKRFAGQSLARLDTYSGKMDLLKKGVDEATKSIGTGLVDALVILSKDESISSLADDFENLGDNIAYAIVEMAKLIKKFDDLVDNPQFQAGLLALAILSKKPQAVVGAMGIIGLNVAGNALTRPRTETQPNVGGYSGIPDVKVAKELLKARKKEYDIINKKNAIENKNVEELKKKFDLERIGITQALNVATDDETKTRLRAQLAILDNNDAMAKKLLAELEAYEALKKLADAAKTLTTTFEQMIETLRASIRSILDSIKPQLSTLKTLTDPTEQNLRSSVSAILESTKPAQNALQNLINPSEEGLRRTIADSLAAVKPSMDLLNLITSGASIQRTSANSPMDIRLTIDGSSDRLSQAIAESIQVANRSGYSTVPNGFIV